MIELHILSGKQAGRRWVVRRFPFRVGREAGADGPLAEEGVWESHFELCRVKDEGWSLRSRPEALTRVNGKDATECRLRNGDTIGVGAVELRFWLATVPQSTLRWREWATWGGLAALLLLQAWLIVRLLPGLEAH